MKAAVIMNVILRSVFMYSSFLERIYLNISKKLRLTTLTKRPFPGSMYIDYRACAILVGKTREHRALLFVADGSVADTVCVSACRCAQLYGVCQQSSVEKYSDIDTTSIYSPFKRYQIKYVACKLIPCKVDKAIIHTLILFI